MTDDLNLVQVAVRAAEAAAAHLRTIDRPPREAWVEKGPSDFVTQVDREIEERIVEQLCSEIPESTVMGEELSPTAQSATGVVWVVDPIDGTINYLHDYPQYAISIAAVADGVLAGAAVVDVAAGETYRAWRNGGAWHGERRLQVSTLSHPRWALVGTGFPFKHLDLLPPFQNQLTAVLEATAGVRRGGSASLDLVTVAMGRLDAFWELMLAPWDVAAGALIIREAGGRVTDLDGNHDILKHGALVAGNPALHAWLLDAVRNTP